MTDEHQQGDDVEGDRRFLDGGAFGTEHEGHHPSVVVQAGPPVVGAHRAEFIVDAGLVACPICIANVKIAIQRFRGVIRTETIPALGKISAEYAPSVTSVRSMREAARPSNTDRGPRLTGAGRGEGPVS